MDIFFIYASPKTLTSIINDLDSFQFKTPEMIVIREKCVNELASTVGESEAYEMIEAERSSR